MTWLAIKAFTAQNKWLVYLSLILAIVYFGGNVIVDSIAYFQPKVTIITHTEKQQSVKDKSVTDRHEITRPDGTKELFEQIHNDIQNLTQERNDSDTHKQPVSLTRNGWEPYASYGLIDKNLSLGVAFNLGQFSVGVAHPVLVMDSQLRFPGSFNPVVWGTWRP